MKTLLGIMTTLAAFCLVSIAIAQSDEKPAKAEEPAQPETKVVDISGEPARGNPEAPIIVLEFLDYQCPYCKEYAAGPGQQLQKKYVKPGLARVVTMNFPLPAHPHAQNAAAAAECALHSDKFDEYQSMLFARQDTFDEALFWGIAKELELDLVKFEECRHSEETHAEVLGDREVGIGLRVRSTPTVFIGVPTGENQMRIIEKIEGLKDWEEYKTAIESHLPKDLRMQETEETAQVIEH